MAMGEVVAMVFVLVVAEVVVLKMVGGGEA